MNSYIDASSAASLLLEIFHAIPQRVMNAQIYEAFTAIIPPDYIESWLEMMTTWEADPTEALNPFTVKYSRALCPFLSSCFTSTTFRQT